MADYRNRPPVETPTVILLPVRQLGYWAGIAVAGCLSLYLCAVAVGCAA